MKKFVAAVSAAVMLIGAVAGLTACGDPACAHNYEEDTSRRVAATCHSDGTKYLVCTECNDEKTEAITERPSHTFTGEWQKVTDGHARKCADCDAVDTNVSQHNHVEDTEKRVESTCHSDGTKYLVCTECGDEKTEAITERPNHDFENGEYVKVDGELHAKKCAVEGCGAVDENSIAHTWNEGTVTAAPALGVAGEKLLTCNDCGATKTEPVDALTSANHANEFNVSAENSSWGYGKMEVTDWGEDFKYKLTPSTQTTADAYIGDGIEIKGDWLSGSGSYISYTVSADVKIRIDLTATKVEGGKRMDVRTVLGSEARYHWDYNDAGVMTFGENGEVYTLSAGDTVYIFFTPKGDDSGNDQTRFTINISLID